MARLMSIGEFATEGESRTAEQLRGLPNDWVIVANKVLPTRNGRSFEIDFIVIGDHLVFAIDEKSWRGRIVGSDTIWVRGDGSSERSPLSKIDYVSKILAGYIRLKVALMNNDQHFTHGCVLLSATDQLPQVSDPRAANGTVLLKDAVDRLQQIDATSGRSSISRVRESIVSSLVDLSHRPRIPKRIGAYQVEEVLSERHGAYTLRAVHEEAGPRMLTMYNVLSDGAQRDIAKREFRALQRLQGSGIVPEVLDPFDWSDDFLVVPSALPTGSPLRTLPRLEGKDPGIREVALATLAFQSLETIHEAGVIHRALSPDSIYVDNIDGQPRFSFTGFHSARAGSGTIGQYLDDLHVADPYAAPEIGLGYGFATPESDTFSLALVFLERFSGVPIGELVTADGTVAIPDNQATWSFFPEEQVEELIAFFRRALGKGEYAEPNAPDARRLTAKGCADTLHAIESHLRKDDEGDKDRLLDDRYKVIRLLGTGATARTLLVSDTEVDGLFAVKQYLRPDLIHETGEARREFGILRSLRSPHLPQVYDVYRPENDVHVKMEYVEGVPLSVRLGDYEGNLERWQGLVSDLCEAASLLEDNHLLHRDIKPENVLIRDGSGDAVLIDFGAATPVDRAIGPAGTPKYIPPESLFSTAPSPSTDQYALAVLLFTALTGTEPFEGGDQQSTVSEVSVREELRPYAQVLLRAVDPAPKNRYSSVCALREAILTATQKVEEPDDPTLGNQINPSVGLIRRLFRNSAAGNADNRGLDTDFARATYVPTGLDTELLPVILANKPLAVFLSGNPGDGKTAFLEQVKVALADAGGKEISSDESGWVWSLNDHLFRSCYDASEAYGELSANEQLRTKLSGLEGDDAPLTGITALVAINDGRLADFVVHFRGQFGWLTRQIEAGLSDTAEAPDTVWTVDLKRRTYVSLTPDEGGRSVLRQMLDVFVSPDRWNICLSCTAQRACPIRANALALQDRRSQEQLEHLMLLTHLRGERHLTIRDLRSGLAYLITGDTACEQVHTLRTTGQPLPNVFFWHLAFTTEKQHDTMLGELPLLDPGRFARPKLERFLFFNHSASDAGSRAELFRNRVDIAPQSDTNLWIEQVKRRLYFEAAPPEERRIDVPVPARFAMLPYQYAEEFLEILRGVVAVDDILPRLARGISRSDGIPATMLNRGMCLRVAHSDVERMTILKVFPLEMFWLEAERLAGTEHVESFPAALLISHRQGAGTLRITLDLFELLMRFADGLEPASAEFQPMLEDLAPFKSAVLLTETTDLILVEAGKRLHQLTQHDGKVVRLPMVTAP